MMAMTSGAMATGGADSAPRVFVLEGAVLGEVKRRIEAGDGRYGAALEALRREADEVLKRGPYSVTDKTGTPPSGDARDYMSIGPYWWPNPDTDDGLPYVRRDGERNPERVDGTYDAQRLNDMTRDVQTLALAYYLSDHAPYAEHAATLLRTWFLDPGTRMNPHLEYAQAIPGRVDGRGIGIIDTANWPWLIDAVGMLERSTHWSGDDQRQLQGWFEQYIDWLRTSEHGHAERRHPNNHGTWYDTQLVVYLLFCDWPEVAREHLQEWTCDRIGAHFEPDGSQPKELARTRPWHYSVYNLEAHVTTARLGRHVDVHLAAHTTADGRSIRAGLDYLFAYIDRMDQWPHPEPVHAPDPARLTNRLLPAAVILYDNEPHDREAFERLGPDDFQRSRIRLVHPYLFEREGWDGR